MNPIQFGYFLTPLADQYQALLSQCKLADDSGLDLIGIQDHPYQARFFDTWTLITALAAQTQRVRFFPDVVNLPLRPPAVLAKAAASLDIITGGRFELGLGSGAFWEGVRAYGGESRSPGGAVDALEEAIQIIRLMWSGQRGVRFEGKFYQVNGAHSGPVPAHLIGIYLGAIKPRMLALTGRLADGWFPSISYVPPEQLPEMNRRIDEAAQAAGRSPTDVRRLYNVFGKITGGQRGGYLEGPVDYWIDELTRLSVDFGMDSFLFGPIQQDLEQYRLFAEEVAPQVRARLSPS